MPTTDFSLIRHGQTEANIKGILQGHTNTQLDETGICQAQCAAKRLIGEKFDLIFASDLDRALHTARIIVDQIGGEIIPTPKLREWHLGELENRPTKELWETYPQIMECFRTQQTEDIAVPGGESFFEFNKRIADYLDFLSKEYEGKRILLVTHGGVLRSVFQHITGGIVPDGRLLPLISNVSYSRFTRRDGLWQLCCWNDVYHLKDVGVRENVAF